MLLSHGSQLLRSSSARALELALRLGRLGRRGHGRLLALSSRIWVVLNLSSSLKGIPCPHFFKGLWLRRRFSRNSRPRRAGGFNVEQRGGIPEPTTTALSLSDFKPTLPCPELALVGLIPTALLHNTLRRSVVVEWEVQVDIKMIPHGLPHPSPVERVDVVGALRTTLLSASAATPSLSSCRSGRNIRCRADRTSRFALRTIPCAGGYFIQTDTV